MAGITEPLVPEPAEPAGRPACLVAATDRRVPLSRERLLRGAIAVADAGGIAELTIRSLAQALGVKPMSLHHHVPNKEAILDGVVDIVFSEIDLPPTDADWRQAMRRRAVSARTGLRRHPGRPRSWSREPTPDPPPCGTTTRCSARCGAPASRSRWPRTPTRCWTATSTGSPWRRPRCRSTATRPPRSPR